MTKRKKATSIKIYDNDLNDGSGSDDAATGYTPRAATQQTQRVHHLSEETVSVGADGRLLSTFTQLAVPASPSKRARAALNPDNPPSPPEPVPSSESWIEDFSEFDAEYGPGLQSGPRELRGSDNPNEQWACMDREMFLDELIRQDGHGDYAGQKWDGTLFQQYGFKSLGLRIQLGHPPGERCPNPLASAGDDFVFVNTHTIDEISLDYWTNPRSAATFAALERFDLLTLESKCSAYEFYNSLQRGTDNTGIAPVRERYDEFLRMTRQWQNLHLLKRAGRGHDPSEDRIAATKAGECALLCPACPHLGKNLPPGWETVAFDKGHLYAQFLALDADFRLKHRDVSTEEKDPGLATGLAFFGEVKKYMAHLDKNWDYKQPRSTCVAHDAVNKPDREFLGTASSGIGTVDCARHNMKRPLGVGDLQKGERQVMPFEFKEDEKFVVFLVPKFHLPAHIEQCNIDFSFNLTPFVGRTDGEAPERGWADVNRLANSTSVSGPGARRDTLDVHFQDSNWKKIVKLSGVNESQSHGRADPKQPNPFRSTVQYESLREVKRRLADIAAEDVELIHVRGDMHETEMLSMGLQLEEQQRQLATHAKHVGAHETPDQGRRRVERETKLRRKIEAWMVVQQLFIPEVALLRDREDAARERVAATQALLGVRAQDMKLWMPSAIGRRVVAFAALETMRSALMVRTHEYHYRDKSLRGVKAKTRSATRVNAIQARVDRAAAEYRAASAALVSLGALLNRHEWQHNWKVLKNENVRREAGGCVWGRVETQRRTPEEESEAESRRGGAWCGAERRGRVGHVVDLDCGGEHRGGGGSGAQRSFADRVGQDASQGDVIRRGGGPCGGGDAPGPPVSTVARRVVEPDVALWEGHLVYACKQAAYMEGLAARFEAAWKDVPGYLRDARVAYTAIRPDEDDGDREIGGGTDNIGLTEDSGWLTD
ncbi:hypothetical protein B0H14DRAFT_2631689 [Mycena olivaceomarginata]|nr:hypothetical protein B0H14DRAFT_2631689 [Mycena olivaceomarginata]